MKSIKRISLATSSFLFALGFLAGIVLAAAGQAGNSSFSLGLSALELFEQNLAASTFLFGGILTFGLTTLFSLLLNGVFLGSGAYIATEKLGLLFLLKKLLPHGLFEIPAICLAGATGFLSLTSLVQVLRGKSIQKCELLKHFLATAALSLVLFAIGALVEVGITRNL